MKRIMCFILLLCLILPGCSTYNADNITESKVGYYEGDIIPNEATAIKVSSAILEGISNNKEFDWDVLKVTYSKNEGGIWTITLCQKAEQGKVMIGNSFIISLYKKDGRVKEIIAEE